MFSNKNAMQIAPKLHLSVVLSEVEFPIVVRALSHNYLSPCSNVVQSSEYALSVLISV